MKVNAIDSYRVNNTHFEGKKNKEIQKPVHSSNPMKAIPVAVLIAMSPLNAPKADAVGMNNPVVEASATKPLRDNSPKARSVMQNVSEISIKTLYAARGIDKINIVKRIPIETRPYFGLSRSDIYCIDNNNDKKVDDILVVLQSWNNGNIQTAVCLPEDLECSEKQNKCTLSTKAAFMRYYYDHSADKVTSATMDKNIKSVNFDINDNNLVQALVDIFSN